MVTCWRELAPEFDVILYWYYTCTLYWPRTHWSPFSMLQSHVLRVHACLSEMVWGWSIDTTYSESTNVWDLSQLDSELGISYSSSCVEIDLV